MCPWKNLVTHIWPYEYISTRFFTYVKYYMIISGILRFALSFVNSFPWFQVATNVMILVLSSEYTTMGPNTFEIVNWFLCIQAISNIFFFHFSKTESLKPSHIMKLQFSINCMVSVHRKKKGFEGKIFSKRFYHNFDMEKQVSSVYEGKKEFKCKMCAIFSYSKW